jgi:hypothetical protein
MQGKLEGARDIRTALRALSSFVQVVLVTAPGDLPRPHAIVFQAEPGEEP